MLDFVKHNQWLGLLSLVLLAGLWGCAAQQPVVEADSKPGPENVKNRKFFEQHVMPTLQTICTGCHTEKSRFVSYQSSLKFIKPGDPDQSPMLLAPLGQWVIPGGQNHITVFWVAPTFYQNLQEWILAEQ